MRAIIGIAILIVAMFFVLLGVYSYTFDRDKTACESRGGDYIDIGHSTYACLTDDGRIVR